LLPVRPAALLLALVALSASLPPAGAATECPLKFTAKSDDDLRTGASSGCWGLRGSGTATDPFVITGTDVLALTRPGVDLERTTLHVVIRDATITGGGSKHDGIHLVDVDHVRIENVTIDFSRACVSAERAQHLTIANSTLRACSQGLALKSTTLASVTANRIAVNDNDVLLSSSTRNTFKANNLSIANGQIGFSFADNASYDNALDETNVVNFIPVRWHVRLAGTKVAPRAITNETVGVRGITNVAQVMCMSCSNVTFTGIDVRSGAASGLVLVDPVNVTVSRSNAEGNGEAGFAVVRGSDVRLEDVNAAMNGRGAKFDATRTASVLRGTFRSNAKEGLLLENAAGASVESAVAAENKDGVVLVRSSWSRLANLTLERNAGDGARVQGGTSDFVGSVNASGNAGAGLRLDGSLDARVVECKVSNDSNGGIVLTNGAAAVSLLRNDVTANGEGGIRLVGAGPRNLVANNTFSAQRAHVRLHASEGSDFVGNRIEIAPGETGFVFDDERSYQNTIDTTNKVGDSSVHWNVATAGTAREPVVFRDIVVDAPNVTNVGQFVLYKASYVRVENVTASNGTRGISILRSSSIDVRGAAARHNDVGVNLDGTMTVNVTGTDVEDNGKGVLVADTSNATISYITARGSDVAVEFQGAASRGGVVQGVNATGVLAASVHDPSFVAGPPPRSFHRIVDAGLDKVGRAVATLAFSDAVATAQFGSGRIVRQSWDFGDGFSLTSENDSLMRPSYSYSKAGVYIARYTVETADGLALSDTVQVTIRSALPPSGLTAERGRHGVALSWSPATGPFEALKYRAYRGTQQANLSPLAETKDASTTFEDRSPLDEDAWYAVSALTLVGESPPSVAVFVPAPDAPTDGAPASELPPDAVHAARQEHAPTPGVTTPVTLAMLAAGAIMLGRRSRGSR
jgi:hypothetical protein